MGHHGGFFIPSMLQDSIFLGELLPTICHATRQVGSVDAVLVHLPRGVALLCPGYLLRKLAATSDICFSIYMVAGLARF
jgi:hypothetical protein